jgi:hypothetical protein
MKSVEEVNELRQVICDYYARRVDDEMDRLWEEGKWDNEKKEAILQEHLRTPYRGLRLCSKCNLYCFFTTYIQTMTSQL